MNHLMNFLLFAQPQGTQGGSSSWMSFLPILLIVVVFYFFFIRPQMKKSKELKKFRESLQKGQRIITIGGIHGKIVEMQEQTVTIDSDGTRLRISKEAIAQSIADQIQPEAK